MRINKYLAECGVCSRRKADELVLSGRVSVNKKVVTAVGTDIDIQNDVVYVDGKKVVRVTHYDYVMFNKPKGCVTTLNDERDNKSGRPKKESQEDVKERVLPERKKFGYAPDERAEHKGVPSSKNSENAFASNNASKSAYGASKNAAGTSKNNDESASEQKKPRKTVYDYLDEDVKERRLFPVGRLDYDSEGLLLLTNDGELTHRLTHPSSEISKTYVVKIEGNIEESDLAILRKGVTVDGVKYGRAKVKVTGIEEGNTRLEVVIFEGKNREVRRMFEGVEKNVIYLKRVAIGELRLGGLSRGGSRELSEGEIAYLKSLCKIG